MSAALSSSKLIKAYEPPFCKIKNLIKFFILLSGTIQSLYPDRQLYSKGGR